MFVCVDGNVGVVEDWVCVSVAEREQSVGMWCGCAEGVEGPVSVWSMLACP